MAPLLTMRPVVVPLLCQHFNSPTEVLFPLEVQAFRRSWMLFQVAAFSSTNSFEKVTMMLFPWPDLSITTGCW